MHFSTAVLAAASAALAQAATISVAVGNGSLTFSPNDIKASVGDSIEFSFFPKNHSVTQSSFANPCHPLADGFFSTFVPTTAESNKTFTILVNDTKPIWIYCAQTTLSHCQSGMVAAINAPATGNTLAAFTALAKNATASTSPPDTVALGGILAVKGSTEEVKTVTTSVTTTITATVTAGGSTYATTYATSYGTTYTTDIVAQATNTASSAGSGSGSGSSSTTSSGTAQSTNGAGALAVNGGVAGAVLVAAWAML